MYLIFLCSIVPVLQTTAATCSYGRAAVCENTRTTYEAKDVPKPGVSTVSAAGPQDRLYLSDPVNCTLWLVEKNGAQEIKFDMLQNSTRFNDDGKFCAFDLTFLPYIDVLGTPALVLGDEAVEMVLFLPLNTTTGMPYSTYDEYVAVLKGNTSTADLSVALAKKANPQRILYLGKPKSGPAHGVSDDFNTAKYGSSVSIAVGSYDAPFNMTKLFLAVGARDVHVVIYEGFSWETNRATSFQGINNNGSAILKPPSSPACSNYGAAVEFVNLADAFSADALAVGAPHVAAQPGGASGADDYVFVYWRGREGSYFWSNFTIISVTTPGLPAYTLPLSCGTSFHRTSARVSIALPTLSAAQYLSGYGQCQEKTRTCENPYLNVVDYCLGTSAGCCPFWGYEVAPTPNDTTCYPASVAVLVTCSGVNTSNELIANIGVRVFMPFAGFTPDAMQANETVSLACLGGLVMDDDLLRVGGTVLDPIPLWETNRVVVNAAPTAPTRLASISYDSSGNWTYASAALGNCTVTSSASTTQTPSSTKTASTMSPSPSRTPTVSLVSSHSPSPSRTPTVSLVSSHSPSPSRTPTVSLSHTIPRTLEITPSRTSTSSKSPSPSLSGTLTPIPTASRTLTQTPTDTVAERPPAPNVLGAVLCVATGSANCITTTQMLDALSDCAFDQKNFSNPQPVFGGLLLRSLLAHFSPEDHGAAYPKTVFFADTAVIFVLCLSAAIVFEWTSAIVFSKFISLSHIKNSDFLLTILLYTYPPNLSLFVVMLLGPVCIGSAFHIAQDTQYGTVNSIGYYIAIGLIAVLLCTVVVVTAVVFFALAFFPWRNITLVPAQTDRGTPITEAFPPVRLACRYWGVPEGYWCEADTEGRPIVHAWSAPLVLRMAVFFDRNTQEGRYFYLVKFVADLLINILMWGKLINCILRWSLILIILSSLTVYLVFRVGFLRYGLRCSEFILLLGQVLVAGFCVYLSVFAERAEREEFVSASEQKTIPIFYTFLSLVILAAAMKASVYLVSLCTGLRKWWWYTNPWPSNETSTNPAKLISSTVPHSAVARLPHHSARVPSKFRSFAPVESNDVPMRKIRAVDSAASWKPDILRSLHVADFEAAIEHEISLGMDTVSLDSDSDDW